MPKPPAAFSPFTTTKSSSYWVRITALAANGFARGATDDISQNNKRISYFPSKSYHCVGVATPCKASSCGATGHLSTICISKAKPIKRHARHGAIWPMCGHKAAAATEPIARPSNAKSGSKTMSGLTCCAVARGAAMPISSGISASPSR